jgi:hypothetical protein
MSSYPEPRSIAGAGPRRAAGASARQRIATRPRPPLQCSSSTQAWLDFLAGLLAQAAWAERGETAGPENAKAA